MRPHEPGQSQAIEQACQAFAEWAEAHAGASIELGLSSHGLLLAGEGAGPGPGADAASLSDAAQAQAQAHWAHYLDLPQDKLQADWRVQTSLDAGRAPVAAVCAVPRELLQGLQLVAKQHRVRLLAVQPWWANSFEQAWQALPTGPQAGEERCWSWREGDWSTRARLQAEEGRWVLTALSLTAGDPVEGAAVGQELACAPDALPKQADALAWMAPQADADLAGRPRTFGWAESLNFAGPRVQVSFWSWALLALSCIAVFHTWQLRGQVGEAEQSAQADLDRLQRHARARDPRAASALGETGPAEKVARTAPAAAAAPALTAEGWTSAAQLAAWLGHPWAPVLDQVDASAHAHGVSLMRFQLDLGTWGSQAGQPVSWRSQAAVSDDAAVLAWLKDLGPTASWQRREALAEPVPSERGTLAWRVDVNALGRQP